MRCYAPVFWLVVFALVVMAGADPHSPTVLVPFLLAEAVALAGYVSYIRSEMHDRHRRR